MSLEQSDAEAAAVAIAPRVTLADIEAAIAHRYHFTGGDAVWALQLKKTWNEEHQCYEAPRGDPLPEPLRLLSICLVVMKNGFTVIGKSAPASPANFNAELGRKLAYEDCVRQIWPLMGFALRERLACGR